MMKGHSGQAALQLPPLSLYVHVPWCVRKCPYCDFNSHAQQGDLPEQAYLRSLLADFEQERVWVQGRSLQSIFIGGGTPSLLSGGFYRSLLTELAQRLPFAADIEITLEANPGTFEQARFAAYRAAGINRLSLGVQSFSSQRLQALGRIHSGQEAIDAVVAAKALGFERLNLDLMHGLPGQDLQQAMADLEQAIDLDPSHLSWYQLTIEPNTEFHSRPPRLPADDTLWSIQQSGLQQLQSGGYQQYEISAYARDHDHCRHNLNYWRFGDYIGIGAGAHGKLTDLSQQRLVRRWKTRQPKAYMQTPIRASEEIIAEDALLLEFMMNALRLNDGVEATLFSQRTGLPSSSLQSVLAEARARGLMVADLDRLAPTAQGGRFLNDLLALFF